MKKKLLIFFGIPIILIFIIFGYYFLSKKQLSKTPATLFTGAIFEDPTKIVISKPDIQRVNLMKQLPLNTQEFQVDFDYKKFVFVVTLQAPYEENKQKFMNWLLVSGYESIPKTDITFLIPE